MPLHWNVEHQLTICVLGPMASATSLDARCVLIGRAIRGLLKEPELKRLLLRNGTAHVKVEIPEDQHGSIARAIFSKVDVADLVIVDITPEGGA
jgi:hypothetical protein